MAETEALREAGADRECLLEVLLGLDALGDDQRPGAFVVREHAGQGGRPVALGAVLDHRHVELDDVGVEDVEHGKRIGMCANVVDGNRDAVGADGLDLLQQPLRVCEHLTLGEFEDHLEAFTRGAQRRLAGPGDVCHCRLGVDEQQAATRHRSLECAPDGSVDALLVENVGAPRSVGEGEDVLRGDRVEHRPAGQGFVTDHPFVGQGYHRLEHRNQPDTGRRGVDARIGPDAKLADQTLIRGGGFRVVWAVRFGRHKARPGHDRVVGEAQRIFATSSPDCSTDTLGTSD